MTDAWYIVGLGNPGQQYADTRHNIGRAAAMVCADNAGVQSWHSEAHNAVFVAYGTVGASPAVFILPELYMNKSGEALAAYGVSAADAARVIVVHDDIDLPLGTVRIARSRGAGGHNGVSSIVEALGTNAFVRVRIGVAPRGLFARLRQPRGPQTADFVLARFNPVERRVARTAAEHAATAVRTVIEDGVEQAMNEYNRGT